MIEPPELEKLESKLGYKFREINFLKEALTHKSFANEKRALQVGDNERLEFLGDAVLDLLISYALFKKYPELKEGGLSKKRAAMVREETLCEMAIGLDIGHHILIGKGEEQSAGREKSSILADTFEAVVAAVYLDGGIEKAEKLVENLFSGLILSPSLARDFKSALQELCQKEKRGVPRYDVVGEEGPDHNKLFEVVLEVDGEAISNGRGKSVKEAEQTAAKRALKEVYQVEQ